MLLLYLMISCFGADAISGGSQIALLSATSVCVMISIFFYGGKWSKLEDAIVDNIKASASAIIILLLIGSISGSWMLSGVVPTLIYYGLEILNPNIFLLASCVICALVALLTGSSWTTIATIGVALMGIGTALGLKEGWVAGAIISGAYFGDKMSILSDTTVLASSCVDVPIFKHIKYMVYTSLPAFILSCIVFTIAGFALEHSSVADVSVYSNTLHESFNISPWLLLIPILTGILIALKLPAIITLFLSCLFACIALLISQPQIMSELLGVGELTGMLKFKAIVLSCYSPTEIITSSPQVTDLIATRGMSGMLNTVWLIICAMCFGGVMTGSGMLDSITKFFLKIVSGPTTSVASTLGSGIFFNICTADQYISIILNARLFKHLYEQQGLEARLLSRSVEDSATVTSVLVPWNSCSMAQSTVLGVSAFTFLPYCVFNIASPIISFLVVMLRIKIKTKH
ncbi:MAG: Na+/H+ antiporter NhaC family protein [Rikenellaceae bacterium]